jgi:uncharacterized protein (DUF1800 family)
MKRISHPPRFALIAATALIAVCCARTQYGETNPAPLASDPRDIALLDRISWGANTASAQLLREQGAQAYLDSQIQPDTDDDLPRAVANEIASYTIQRESAETLVKDLHSRREAAKALSDPDQIAKAQQDIQQILAALEREAQSRAILRDIYSRDQLREVMTWFWFNHFNIGAGKGDLRALVGDYEETAIRPHVFGRFRDLLDATLHHPAMLIYLDNAQNAVGRINENYAREIMELHTLGVGGGYTQKDVEELARILTGVGVNRGGNTPKIRPELRDLYVRQGMFEFNPNRHDFGTKLFLGHTIAGNGFAEVNEAIDILSRSPATARFISSKIAQYFVADDPPQTLVEQMTARFEASDGDIAEVLRTMFASPEFGASLGRKFKDPMQYVMSAVRTVYSDKVILNTTPVLNWLKRLGEAPYRHQTPDGYPTTRAAWSGSGDLASRFEIARIIASGRAPLFDSLGAGAVTSDVPAISAERFFKGVGPTLSTTTDQVLAQADSPADWNALYLSSPEFMQH